MTKEEKFVFLEDMILNGPIFHDGIEHEIRKTNQKLFIYMRDYLAERDVVLRPVETLARPQREACCPKS